MFINTFLYFNLVILLCVQVEPSDPFKSIDPAKTPCSLNNYCTLDTVATCNILDDLNTTNCAVNDNETINIGTFQIFFPDLFGDSKIIIRSNLVSFINLIKMVYFKSSTPPTYPLEIDVEDLFGIDIAFFEPLKSIQQINRNVVNGTLSFMRGSFTLYNQSRRLETCNSQIYQVFQTKSGENFLNVFNEEIRFSYTKFESRFCKFMFQNVAIRKIYVYEYSFAFAENVDESLLLNSSIQVVELGHIERFEMTTKSLDPDVFKEMREFGISDSSIYIIQADLFKNRFLSIRQIKLEIRNKYGVLHSGVAWIKYLNSNRTPIAIDMSFTPTVLTRTSNSTLNAIKRFNEYGIEVRFLKNHQQSLPANYSKSLYPFINYQFPNEDFCLFYDLPLERLVFVEASYVTNVSCTLAWLYRYQHFYPQINIFSFNPSIIPSNCDFNRSLELCNITEREYQDDPYFLFYHLNHGLQIAKSVLITYVRPIACGFGFITNILIVLTIAYNQKRRQEIRAQPKNKNQEIVMLEQFLYKYILLNSILNSLYTFMYLLDSLIPCIQLKRMDFLSSNNPCVLKNYVLDTIGSVVKLMSNFSYIQISINRFLLVGKDHPEWLIYSSQIKIKTFFLITFLFSLSLSSVIYFQNNLFVFQIEAFDYEIGHDDLYVSYYIGNQGISYMYDEMISKINQIPLLSSFITIHDLFSYFLFCLISLILDVVTVKKLHAALKEKARVKGVTTEKQQKSRESERKSIMMIVLSSLTNFLFRAPELLSIIFYYSALNHGAFVFKMLCFSYYDCLLFVDFSKVFYVLSLGFQLLFYLKFNSVFRLSFTKLFKNYCTDCCGQN